ncbi:MAG: 2'-deoxycytidine 5'-triphosphate deaminase, partial [Nisaea sp.]
MTADASTAATDSGTREKRTTGILPSQTIREMIKGGQIASDTPVIDGQIQPSSIDLRLGDEAYRVRASFLPGRNATVADRLETLAMHKIDLRDGAVLEKGCVYIVRLQEGVSLPPKVSGTANPKSS